MANREGYEHGSRMICEVDNCMCIGSDCTYCIEMDLL